MGEARRAFVTGTSTGIGRAIALALARDGFDLAISELETEWLDEVLQHPDLRARKVVPVHLDLRDEASIEAAFARALDGLGEIDLLVNNAGRSLVKPVTEVEWTDWDDVMNTNLKGAFFLSQKFGRYCLGGGRPGCIVSMASAIRSLLLVDASSVRIAGFLVGRLAGHQDLVDVLGVEVADRALDEVAFLVDEAGRR